MQPGDRQQMREPRGNEILVFRRRNVLLKPGQQGHGDRSGRDRQGLQNVSRDGFPQSPQPHGKALAGRRPHQRHAAQGKAAGAEIREKRVAPGIPAAGIGRAVRLEQQRAHRDNVAGRQNGGVAGAQFYADVARLRHPVRDRIGQRDAAAIGQNIHRLHRPLHNHGAACKRIQQRRHLRGPPLHAAKTQRRGEQQQSREARVQPPPAGRQRRPRAGHKHTTQPKRRFRGQRKIPQDRRPHGDRQQQNKPPQLSLHPGGPKRHATSGSFLLADGNDPRKVPPATAR